MDDSVENASTRQSYSREAKKRSYGGGHYAYAKLVDRYQRLLRILRSQGISFSL